MYLSDDTFSYPLFAVADMAIYPHAVSEHHAWPLVVRGIAMPSVDKFPYPWKQPRGNEFIPWSNEFCHILKRFHSFKTPAIPFIWFKTSYQHSINSAPRSGKEKWAAVVIAIVPSSITFLSLFISRWWRHTWDTRLYLMVVRESAPSMGWWIVIIFDAIYRPTNAVKPNWFVARFMLASPYTGSHPNMNWYNAYKHYVEMYIAILRSMMYVCFQIRYEP